MIVFALMMHVCTMQIGLSFGLNNNADNYTMSCAWADGRGALYATKAACEAEGNRRVKEGPFGDDIASVTHKDDKFRCVETQVSVR